MWKWTSRASKCFNNFYKEFVLEIYYSKKSFSFNLSEISYKYYYSRQMKSIKNVKRCHHNARLDNPFGLYDSKSKGHKRPFINHFHVFSVRNDWTHICYQIQKVLCHVVAGLWLPNLTHKNTLVENALEKQPLCKKKNISYRLGTPVNERLYIFRVLRTSHKLSKRFEYYVLESYLPNFFFQSYI